MSTPYSEDTYKRSSASSPGPLGVGIERDMQTIPWFIATEDTLKGNHNRGSFSNTGNQSPRLLDPPRVLHSLCKYLFCPCNNTGSWWGFLKYVMPWITSKYLLMTLEKGNYNSKLWYIRVVRILSDIFPVFVLKGWEYLEFYELFFISFKISLLPLLM